MYEQGIDPAYEGTPLASGTSSGVHESQSRLWENIVGPQPAASGSTSTPGCRPTSPTSSAACRWTPSTAPSTRSQRSLIRTDADEVTYNLHVMIRFDLELALLEGRLAVKDLPEAWRARYSPTWASPRPTTATACCRTCTGTAGVIGGCFQGYTLGNILGAQFFAAAQSAHPEIPAEIAAGRVRHPARLAQREHLPARPQVHRRRAGGARHRRPADHRALHGLPARQVRGAVRAGAG